MNSSRLYTYLPKDNTALTEGLLSTALSPNGWEKYKGRTNRDTRDAVLKVLDSWEPEWIRSKALSALTQPIPDDATEDLLEFAKNHELYSFDVKDLIKAKILAHLRLARKGGGTDPVEDVKSVRPNWYRKKRKHLLFKGIPHYFVETNDGKIPPELIRHEKKASAADLKELARLMETLSRLRGSAKYLTVPGLKLRGADVEAAARLFGARRADPAKYAVWLNRILNKGVHTPDLLIDKGIPLLHNPKFIIDRLSRTGWTASPEALRRAGVMQVNAAPFFSLDGGAFVATPSEVQAFKNGLFPFRSMYGKSVIGRDAMGNPIYVPWRISNHVNTVVPVRESIGASKTGRYYDILRDAEANVDPRLLTGHQVSRGSFDLFVPRGQEAGIRFDWQEPYGTTGFYGGPKLGGLGDWGGIPRGSGLIKHSEVNCNIGDSMTM